MPKFLIIQTAFIGDVVLATALAEKLHAHYPSDEIHFLLRKGNEALLKGHPFISRVHIWNKTRDKNRNLLRIIGEVRKERYTHVINPHRFATSGLITALSGAPNRIGFDKNPLSFAFTRKIKHFISEPYSEKPVHETDRNQWLITEFTDPSPARPRLYPSQTDREKLRPYQQRPYVTISPTSVWFTKQYPPEKWQELLAALPHTYNIYLLGGPGDKAACQKIADSPAHPSVVNLAGELGFLESIALMESAEMNYVNDSAPQHFASSVNAPVTAVFCSTVPAFGFGPLSDERQVVEIEERLYCRPCGLHGHRTCPEGHFRCAKEIKTEQLLWWISKQT